MNTLVRGSRDLAGHLDEERSRAKESLGRAERVEQDLHRASPPGLRMAPRHAGIAALLELKDQLDRGPAASTVPPLSRHVEQTHDSVRSVQKSLEGLGQTLAKRREHRAKQVLVVQVDPKAAAAEAEPRDDAESAEKTLSKREQLRKQRQKVRGLHATSRTRGRVARLCLVLLMGLVVSPLVARFLPVSAYAVATSSMEPIIPQGALVMASAKEPVVGDVVVYHSVAGEYQIHRVVEAFEVNGEPAYTTRGDANEAADSFTVMASDVKGVVFRSTPLMGSMWLVPDLYKVGILLVLVMAYLGVTLWDHPRGTASAKRAVGAGLIATALLMPGAMGAVGVTEGDSTPTLNVQDPTPIPLVAGDEGVATIGANENSATVDVGPVTLWKEIVMWGCVPTDHAATGCAHVPPPAYGTVVGSLIQVDLTKYNPDPTFYLEAYLEADAGETVFVRLWDTPGAVAVAGSELSTTSTDLVRVRSPAFTLAADSVKEYQFQTHNSGVGAGGAVQMVKLITAQVGTVDTVTQVVISGASRTSGQVAFTQLARTRIWENDETDFDGTVAIYFEVVGSGRGQIKLRDTEAPADRNIQTFNGAGVVRKRSLDLAAALVTGDEHQVQGLNDALQNVDVHTARMIITQTGLTKTLRYVDLTMRATTASAAFVTVGYDGRYSMDSEWEATQGRFEASILNVLAVAGASTFARVFDRNANAEIAASEVSISSSTLGRVRSGLFSLNGADGDYAARVKSSSAASEAEIRSAWLIIVQDIGKTFDHVLASEQDSGTCTWEYTMEHGAQHAETNLGRIDSAVVRLTNGVDTQDQIEITNGAVTTTSGAPVVLSGTDVRHIVYLDPDSSGASSIEVDLVATCQEGGITVRQPITFDLN